tara:strand:+ start:321 stop:1511 length:1191 start_codon:yes stop_codon:yes gene_type:complete
MPENKGKFKYLVGSKNVSNKALEPYNKDVCDFLDDFSKMLFKEEEAKKYSDLKTLAFWCRKSEISKFKSKLPLTEKRMGLGLIFHITPANIPTNFAYSLIFGLLTGNSNIVKVPSQEFKQVEVICNCINRILKKKYKIIRDMLSIVRYSEDDNYTKEISKKCNARMIWGGDKTISAIKLFPTDHKSLDITFPDRYSFCAINSTEILKLNTKSLRELSLKFYNDTFLVDQNACTSPHLIVWLGKNKTQAKNQFWQSLYKVVKEKYDLGESALFDKLTNLYNSILSSDKIKNFKKFGNLIYVLELKEIEIRNHKFRGKWGFFYELNVSSLDQLKHQINSRYQTLSYFGIDKDELKNFIFKNNLNGIDRVVPIGQTLDMNLFWDGYDINRILTRVIDIK